MGTFVRFFLETALSQGANFGGDSEAPGGG